MNINFLKDFTNTAIIDDKGEYSFSDLIKNIKRYEDEFRIYENKNIAIISDFNFESISLILALAGTSNSIVPIVFTTDEEVQKKINVSKINLKINIDSNNKITYESIALKHEKIYNKPGIVLFSSGTTGEPKMMFHEYDKLFKVLENPPRKQRVLRILLFLMFDHIGGINTFLNCLRDGSTIVIPSNRTPEYVLNIIKKHKVNVLPTTPTFINLLLISGFEFTKYLSSLKLISYGTERMPESVLIKIKKLLPNVKFLQTFGTSETGILKTISKSSDSLYFKIEDERYEFKIIENILFIKSNLNISGYLNSDNNKFDKDGWYNTGDIVKVDDDGYMMIVGRVNEIINVGGLKVLPNEVESILLQHININDCLVFGEYNPITGQMVSAKIVLSQKDLEKFSELDIKNNIKTFCKSKLDKYKIPAKIIFVDKLDYSNRFKKSLK